MQTTLTIKDLNAKTIDGTKELEIEVDDFDKTNQILEELGYKNYWQDLIATDYGIPQTRNRTFMVSILGDYNYTFPKPIPLKLKLKDLLEDKVDEKYYLSEKMIQFFLHNEEKQKENGNGFRFNVSNGETIAKTITTNAGSRMDDNYIEIKNTNCKGSSYLRDFGSKGKLQDDVCNTITASMGSGGGNTPLIKIKNATKKGYLEATVGDGINISGRMEYQRGNVQKEKAQSITCGGGNNLGVIVNE